jgi:OmpR-family two-component system manganese-sensing response regulator
MAKVLVADDDRELVDSVKSWLEHEQFKVDTAFDGLEAKEFMLQGEYDVVILDWAMPSLTGVDVCKWFRLKGGTTPVLLLTGKDGIDNIETGLDSGADDYLTKPFSLRELTARLRALTRRGSVLVSSTITIGPLKIDPDTHVVLLDGTEVKLTATEFSLLEYMAKHPNQVFSADALIVRVWKTSAQISPDTVRVYIRRLREKFEAAGHPGLLTNLHGVGYKLALTAEG